MSTQYAIKLDCKYIKRNGNLTNFLSKAHLVDTKKRAKELLDEHGGEIVEIFLSTADLSVPPPVQSVWLVKRYCQIYGLSIYGPFFTAKEANSMFNAIIDEADHSLLGKFVKYYGAIMTAENRLGDKLEICEIKRAKL